MTNKVFPHRSEFYQWLCLIFFMLGLLLLIDRRFRQVEKARCELWEWDVCVKTSPNFEKITCEDLEF